VIAHAIGPVASLSSAGGDGGDYGANQGPGGNAGAIFAWTNAPLFDDQQLVTSDGGNGNPTGLGGGQHQDASPSGLTIEPSTGILSFTSHSPDASGYEVMRSQQGVAPVVVTSTTLTSDLRPSAPMCVPVTFTVVAVNNAEQWTSDPSGSVSYVRQPSTKQTCSQAPKITAVGKPKSAAGRLRRSGWAATVLVRSSGIGTLQALKPSGLASSGHRTGHAKPGPLQISRPGRLRLHLMVPRADRQPGVYLIRIRTISPNGKGHRTIRLRLRIIS
jgi:hypothetical protein